MKRKNLLLILLLIFLSLTAYYNKRTRTDDFFIPAGQLETAYDEKRSGIQVTGTGVVVKLLADDTKGSKHQKMIVKIGEKHTILIAHNISLAPRAEVKEGDTITFHGEYEWNEKGGIVHWTHHDPQQQHPNGYLKVNGIQYQ